LGNFTVDNFYSAISGQRAQPKKAANRATRRRDGAERRRRAAIWKHLIRQGAGTYTVTVWRVDGPTPDYVACAAILGWTEAVATGKLDPLCLCCDERPIPPAAFSILSPHVDRPEALSVSGICQACATRSDDDLIEAAGAALKCIFPDARRLDSVHVHAAGRA
jgi:hypothetical protein